MSNVKLIPIAECGSGKDGTLICSYAEIKKIIGFKPNATEFDDPDKVKASWGFQDNQGRKAFIWCYKWTQAKSKCTSWSVSGSVDLLRQLFPQKISFIRV